MRQCVLTLATSQLTKTTTMIRKYSELKRLDTFEDRFKYLVLHRDVGVATFGYDRWLNQRLYTSREWKDLRAEVIVRDNGCDLGVEGYEIHTRLLVHHINPVTARDIIDGDEWILDPQYLITTSHNTHNAIHFGDERLLPKPHVPRSRGDTKLW